jgi:hypothetical protein
VTLGKITAAERSACIRLLGEVIFLETNGLVAELAMTVTAELLPREFDIFSRVLSHYQLDGTTNEMIAAIEALPVSSARARAAA